MYQTHDRLLSLAAQIVSAHVGHNDTNANELPALIQEVYGTLSNLEPTNRVAAAPVHAHTHAHAPAARRAPANAHAVANDHLVCLEDGLTMKMLKRHLITVHGLTPDEYREKWGLPSDYPMVAPSYAALRSHLAKESGLGLRPEARPRRGR